MSKFGQIIFVVLVQYVCAFQVINASEGTRVYDFGNWDFTTDGIVKLEGHVDYFWNKKVTGKDSLLKPTGTVNFPGFWSLQNDTFLQDNPNGLVTFQFRIILPDTLRQYTLKLNSVYSAYEIWANGFLLCKTGNVSILAEDSKPDFQPQRVNLPHAKVIDLSMVVSNFHHKKGGGSWEPVILGEEGQIYKMWLNSFSYELTGSAVILIIALFHLMLFFFYQKEKSYLSFSLFSFTAIFVVAMRGEMVIQELFPLFPYQLDQQLRYIAYYLNIGFIALYIYYVFPKSSKTVIFISLSLAILFSIATLTVPVYLATQISPLFHILAILISVYLLFVVVISRKTQKVESLIFFAGGLGLFATLIHTVLLAYNLIESSFIPTAGYYCFIFFQTVLLAYRHRTIYNQKEKLETNIQYKEMDLQTALSVNNIRSRLNREFRDKLLQLDSASIDDLKINLKKLINSYKLAESTNEKIDSMQKMMNTALDQKLLKEYPSLSKSEREMIQLILLNLTNKEIANIRETSPGAVKVARHRIKKKMNLQNGEDINNVIKNL